MPESIKRIFANTPISPRKRVLGPVISAIVSFFLPGAAQALNGQVVKGGCLMLGWFLMYSVADLNAVFYSIVRILQYVIMVVVSSDAYFIASRMKMGEAVRTWSILFLDIRAPEGSAAVAGGNPGLRTLITGVTVIDGTGAPAFVSDVLIEGGVIGYIRPNIPPKEKEYTIVEGRGRILIPGFVNPCCSSEASVFGTSENTQAIRQGITTEILGQNGQSLAPVKASIQGQAEQYFSAVHGKQEKAAVFDNTGLYLMELERQHYPARVESMIGYGTLRTTVLGSLAGTPDQQELQQLGSRIRSGLTSGAKGISIGLAYPPCSFVGDEELRCVFQVAAQVGGLICVQPPLEEGSLFPCLERLGALAQETGARLQLTNLHAIGADRELGEEFCRRAAQFRAAGVDLTLAVTGLDRLPIGLMALTPSQLWTDLEENIFQRPQEEEQREACLQEIGRRLAAAGGASALRLEGTESMTLAQAADQRNCRPEELILTLLEERGSAAAGVLYTNDEEFMACLVKQPYTSLCTDGRPASLNDYTLPYYLGHYVKDLGVLTMQDAVYRNTMAQAARFRLWDRGLIREGMAADLVLLRPELLPDQLEEGMSRGISKVWVGGALQYDSEPAANFNNLPKTRILGIRMGE